MGFTVAPYVGYPKEEGVAGADLSVDKALRTMNCVGFHCQP